MKYPDLTPYPGPPRLARVPTACVGWLDHRADHSRGDVDEYAVPLLWQLCRRAVAVTRGPRGCPLCGVSSVVMSYQDDTLLLGMGEIRVFGDDVAYAAPDLIVHYVTVHGYAPPQSFIAALLQQPMPWSGGYARLLGQCIE